MTRLDVWLVDQLGSRAAAQKAIAEGRVTVDGEVRPKSHKVQPGEHVEVAAGLKPAMGVEKAPEFAVVYEDDDVLVVDKGPDTVVHPGSAVPSGTLVQALEGRVAGGDDPARPGVIHRLDRDTSGLLVFARNAKAHASLARQMQRREIEREYVALVKGRPPAMHGTIDAPLGRDRKRRTRMSSDTDNPREAITHFFIEEPFADATLLRRGARDGPHPPDPRAPQGDRPSGPRRPRVRRPASFAEPPVPPRPPAASARARDRAPLGAPGGPRRYPRGVQKINPGSLTS